MVDVPVGVERVLYLAAVEPEFRAALLVNCEAAVARRGLKMRSSELAMLRAVPAAQLETTISGMDTSRANLKRRSFLQSVAASAAVLAAAGAAGCSDDDKVPLDGGVVDHGARPDTLPVVDQRMWPDIGILPDIPQDTLPVVDHRMLPDMGILPDIPQDTSLVADGPSLPDKGILPDKP